MGEIPIPTLLLLFNSTRKNRIWIIHGGTRNITVCSSIFYGVAAKIPVHTVKCTGTRCNFSSATMNYPNVTMKYPNTVFLRVDSVIM